MKKLLHLIALTLVFITGITSVKAEIKSLTLQPYKDTYQTLTPSWSHDEDEVLYIGRDFTSWLAFDLGGIPIGSVIKTAKLTLTLEITENSRWVLPANFGLFKSDWNGEGNLPLSNLEQFTSNDVQLIHLTGELIFTGGLTRALRESPDNIAGFQVVGFITQSGWSNNSSFGFWSGNAPDKQPKLELTYETIPEPGSAALLFLGATLLAKRRQRNP